MRITIDIDDDVLVAVKERARLQARSEGEVLSEIAREALTRNQRQTLVAGVAGNSEAFYGFEPLPARGDTVSNQLIDRLRTDHAE